VHFQWEYTYLRVGGAQAQINEKKFIVKAIHRFEQPGAASHIQAITVNEDFTKMLVTCSDRVLILYRINVLAKHTISSLTN